MLRVRNSIRFLECVFALVINKIISLSLKDTMPIVSFDAHVKGESHVYNGLFDRFEQLLKSVIN